MSRHRRGASPLRRKLIAWGALLFAATTLARALVGDKGLVAVWKHRRDAAAIERDISRLEAESDQLRREIQDLRDDPRAVEPIAREDLGFARPGEVVILFPRPGPRPPGSR